MAEYNAVFEFPIDTVVTAAPDQLGRTITDGKGNEFICVQVGASVATSLAPGGACGWIDGLSNTYLVTGSFASSSSGRYAGVGFVSAGRSEYLYIMRTGRPIDYISSVLTDGSVVADDHLVFGQSNRFVGISGTSLAESSAYALAGGISGVADTAGSVVDANAVRLYIH